MTEFRLLKRNEYQEAVQLADLVFRDSEHVSMGEAFPQVFSPALGQSYGAFEDDKLTSFIGLVPSILHIEDAEVQAYSIGAVCTHPDYRKQGLASKLLNMVFEHINSAGASVLFISGDLPLYTKAGCTFYGKNYQYEIKRGELKKSDACQIREMQPFDWFQLRKLSNAREIRYEQSIYELAQLTDSGGYTSIFKMKNKILVAENSQGEIQAYLVFALGEKRKDINHIGRLIEWAGDPKLVRPLMAETFSYGITTLIANFPLYETAINKELDALEKKETTFPGTIKIMNLDLLLQQLQPYFKDKQIEIMNNGSDQKVIQYNNQSINIENQQLERLLLKGDIHFVSETGAFPIPFPYPEGLNYV